MIIVWGSVVAAEGRLDELLEVSLEHVRRSRLEDGCTEHGAYVDAENPNLVVFFEKWASEAALREHFAVPASRDFVMRARALSDGPTTMEIFSSEPVAF